MVEKLQRVSQPRATELTRLSHSIHHLNHFVKRFAVMTVAAILICIGAWSFASWRSRQSEEKASVEIKSTVTADKVPLAPLDAHGVSGVLEISKDELIRLMTETRPLTPDEKANLDRGCPGFVCMYQRLGLKRWPAQIYCSTCR